jgi:hypothetical protein
MTLELLGRVHKELSITGSAVYEAVLAIAERVNRKVQIIRLHWQASTLLERMDHVTGQLGQELVEHVARRFLLKSPEAHLGALETVLGRAGARVQDLKQALIQVDTRIRELKLEAIHEDLLRLQRDLSLRSAGIERLIVPRGADAVGQALAACPRSPSVHIATILRGPFLLPPTDDLVLRPDDVVVLVGLQSELALLSTWLTRSAPRTAPAPPA